MEILAASIWFSNVDFPLENEVLKIGLGISCQIMASSSGWLRPVHTWPKGGAFGESVPVLRLKFDKDKISWKQYVQTLPMKHSNFTD